MKIIVKSKKKLISKVIFTPNSKGIFIAPENEWKELLVILNTNQLLTSLKFIIDFKKKIINFHGTYYTWYIKYINYTKHTSYEPYLGFISNDIIILFSKHCPSNLIKFINTMY